MSERENLSEPAAFERLYREHGSPVRSFLRVCLGSASLADDLTQETFLQVWERPHGFDPVRGDLRAYLLGIARKKAADWWRHQKPLPEQRREHAADSASYSVLIANALKQLSADLREVLWLREVEGYSYEELASILKVPLGTVRSRLHSARQQLRNIWSESKETL
jgi:RNA polymerase sigma-70 factor (ECF subfamily)